MCRLAKLTALFCLAVVEHIDLRQAHNLPALPSETTLFVGQRVVDPGDLARRGKEVFVDECVVVRQENTEPRMRVVPAYNSLSLILFVLDLVDVLPRLLGKGNVGASLRGIHARDAGGNFDTAPAFAAKQNTTNFRLILRTSMLA